MSFAALAGQILSAVPGAAKSILGFARVLSDTPEEIKAIIANPRASDRS